MGIGKNIRKDRPSIICADDIDNPDPWIVFVTDLKHWGLSISLNFRLNLIEVEFLCFGVFIQFWKNNN